MEYEANDPASIGRLEAILQLVGRVDDRIISLIDRVLRVEQSQKALAERIDASFATKAEVEFMKRVSYGAAFLAIVAVIVACCAFVGVLYLLFNG